jgi:excinuclease ABC subunit A
VKKFLSALNRLVDAGTSVLAMEHNLGVIKTADWVIDLGPDAGHSGGNILAYRPSEKVRV